MSLPETPLTPIPSDLEVLDGETLTIKLLGEWDLCEAPRLREALGNVDAARRVVFDLSETTYLDSSALRVLVEFKKRSLAMEGSAALHLGDNARSRRILTISGVASLFL